MFPKLSDIEFDNRIRSSTELVDYLVFTFHQTGVSKLLAESFAEKAEGIPKQMLSSLFIEALCHAIDEVDECPVLPKN